MRHREIPFVEADATQADVSDGATVKQAGDVARSGAPWINVARSLWLIACINVVQQATATNIPDDTTLFLEHFDVIVTDFAMQLTLQNLIILTILNCPCMVTPNIWRI